MFLAGIVSGYERPMTDTLTIARVGGQGDGIAETPAGPVFAPLTLPGETVRGAPAGFYWARLTAG